MFSNSMLIRKFYGVDPAIIAAGIAATASTVNAGNQANYAGKNRRQSEKLMNWQKDINLTNWGLENEYNSPKNAMKRLKEAGLNPALMYGSGSGGMSGGSIGGVTANASNQDAPQFEAGGIIQAFVQLQMLDKQKDLLTAQTEAARTNAELASVGIPLKKQEYEQKDILFPGQLTAQELQNKKLIADTQFTLDSNDRAAIHQVMEVKKTNMTIQQGVEAILHSRMQRTKMQLEKDHIAQQISNLKTDQRLKELEIKLKQSSPAPANIIRLINQYFNPEAEKRVKQGRQEADDSWDEYEKRLKEKRKKQGHY